MTSDNFASSCVFTVTAKDHVWWDLKPPPETTHPNWVFCTIDKWLASFTWLMDIRSKNSSAPISKSMRQCLFNDGSARLIFPGNFHSDGSKVIVVIVVIGNWRYYHCIRCSREATVARFYINVYRSFMLPSPIPKIVFPGLLLIRLSCKEKPEITPQGAYDSHRLFIKTIAIASSYLRIEILASW